MRDAEGGGGGATEVEAVAYPAPAAGIEVGVGKLVMLEAKKLFGVPVVAALLHGVSVGGATKLSPGAGVRVVKIEILAAEELIGVLIGVLVVTLHGVSEGGAVGPVGIFEMLAAEEPFGVPVAGDAVVRELPEAVPQAVGQEVGEEDAVAVAEAGIASIGVPVAVLLAVAVICKRRERCVEGASITSAAETDGAPTVINGSVTKKAKKMRRSIEEFTETWRAGEAKPVVAASASNRNLTVNRPQAVVLVLDSTGLHPQLTEIDQSVFSVKTAHRGQYLPMHDGCAPKNSHEYEVDTHPSFATVAARKYSRIGTICHPNHDFKFFESAALEKSQRG